MKKILFAVLVLAAQSLLAQNKPSNYFVLEPMVTYSFYEDKRVESAIVNAKDTSEAKAHYGNNLNVGLGVALSYQININNKWSGLVGLSIRAFRSQFSVGNDKFLLTHASLGLPISLQYKINTQFLIGLGTEISTFVPGWEDAWVFKDSLSQALWLPSAYVGTSGTTDVVVPLNINVVYQPKSFQNWSFNLCFSKGLQDLEKYEVVDLEAAEPNLSTFVYRNTYIGLGIRGVLGNKKD